MLIKEKYLLDSDLSAPQQGHQFWRVSTCLTPQVHMSNDDNSQQKIDGSGLTLGILAGEKQTLNRGYDFTSVLKWFAERADRIILLFDAHKLDISDEFKVAVESIRDHDDKIRLATRQQL